MVIIERDDYLKFSNAFFTVYSKKPEGTFGLGQCAKKLEVFDFNFISFISKNFVYVPGYGYRGFRNFNRILLF